MVVATVQCHPGGVASALGADTKTDLLLRLAGDNGKPLRVRIRVDSPNWQSYSDITLHRQGYGPFSARHVSVIATLGELAAPDLRGAAYIDYHRREVLICLYSVADVTALLSRLERRGAVEV